ncbi:MAG TPA: helicase-associated domain-containing protein [Candidatus Limnocylindrales bacterium]|nr:helicase-associated domain-containing protein [Candidatus Limnocylindrales bacterium]
MPGMLPILRETEPGLIPGLARVWGLKEESADRDELLKALAAAMEDPERVVAVWSQLNAEQRSAIQILYHTPTRSMPAVHFVRVAGDIRHMGSDEIARQNPLQRPQSHAEALYYRGLIGLRRENADTGLRTVLFVPGALAALLPINETSYDKTDDDESFSGGAQVPTIEPLEEDELEDVRTADTSIVDDMTTLLAFLRLEAPALEDGHLPQEVMARLEPFLLLSGAERMRFMLALAHAAGLIDLGNRAAPRSVEARRWLNLPRQGQVRQLAEAWQASDIIDLAHVHGLHIDHNAGTFHQYDPRAVRAMVLKLILAQIPVADWWCLSDFITVVREDNADYQRPNGDFNSWYIQDDEQKPLRGIESWEQVDGALLEYLIIGPLFWLGLADQAEDAARLNAYGRAFMGQAAWPLAQEQAEPLEVGVDGLIVLTRKALRFDRFQVARFSTWLADGDPYRYRLDANGLERAAAQGISLDQIRDFLAKRAPGGELPVSVLQFLDQWRHGAKASVTLEQALLLRTTSEVVLDQIFEEPDLRRYLGARVGPMAVLVRPDQWQALQLALGERGIRLEMRQ